MDKFKLSELIANSVEQAKHNFLSDVRTREFIRQHDRYIKAWNDFKEYHSHARSALLERFMV